MARLDYSLAEEADWIEGRDGSLRTRGGGAGVLVVSTRRRVSLGAERPVLASRAGTPGGTKFERK